MLILLSMCMFLCFFSSQCYCTLYKNNVCKSIQDYKTISNNKNCWYNPDVHSSPASIAHRHGYAFEEHHIITSDGYILNLHRIPKRLGSIARVRQPVLVVHGLGAASVFWMVNGPQSVAFFLADQGYDVWLANCRGSYYSPHHMTMKKDHHNYWDFGLHELAVEDIPAMADYVGLKTGQKGNLIYIGHSMGTTISYIYASEKTKHAEENFLGIISLAPVAFINHIGYWKFTLPALDAIVGLLEKKGYKALSQYRQSIGPFEICSYYPAIEICCSVMNFFTGNSTSQWHAEILPILFHYFPTPVSIKQSRHYIQIIKDGGQFRKYDYGFKRNLDIYHSVQPPSYDLRSIGIPVYLFNGVKDSIATEKDCDTLYGTLNSKLSRTRASLFKFDFAHNDFYFGRNLSAYYGTLMHVMKSLASR